MVHTSSSELVADLVGGGETKVSDGNTEAIVETKDVLGLQVPMINTERVAIFHRVEHLEEDVLDESIVAEISTVMKDLRK